MSDPSAPVSSDVVERLRAAIRRRQDLRPGSRAHWSNECEIRVLQRRLTAIDEERRLAGIGLQPDATTP